MKKVLAAAMLISIAALYTGNIQAAPKSVAGQKLIFLSPQELSGVWDAWTYITYLTDEKGKTVVKESDQPIGPFPSLLVANVCRGAVKPALWTNYVVQDKSGNPDVLLYLKKDTNAFMGNMQAITETMKLCSILPALPNRPTNTYELVDNTIGGGHRVIYWYAKKISNVETIAGKKLYKNAHGVEIIINWKRLNQNGKVIRRGHTLLLGDKRK